MKIRNIIGLIGHVVNDLQNNTSQIVKSTIRNEVSFLGLKLMLGLVIVSVVIFSFIQLGYAYLTWLGQFSDENYLQLVSFATFAMIGIIVLFFLFYSSKRSARNTSKQNEEVDLVKLALSFAAGLADGFKSKNIQE
jgi:hypothetical protein